MTHASYLVGEQGPAISSKVAYAVPLEQAKPLYGKRGIVTGASSGIGRAIAIELGRAGATVFVGYSSNEVTATEVVDEIKHAGGHAYIEHLDVRDSQFPLSAIDFLVNNAGVTAGRSIGKIADDDWQNVLDVDLTGPMRMMRAVVPSMVERGYGRIVNVSSVVGIDGRLGPSSYAAAKAGLIGLTKAAAHELAKKGVTVNAIVPGFIDHTGLLASVPEKLKAKVLEGIPMGRFGVPEDVAHAALYLIAHGDYVTGSVLNVSGGWWT